MDLYSLSYHNALINGIKDKWIIHIDPARNGGTNLYYITGSESVSHFTEERELLGYHLIMNKEREVEKFYDRVNDVHIETLLYCVDVTDKTMLKKLDDILAKHILLK